MRSREELCTEQSGTVYGAERNCVRSREELCAEQRGTVCGAETNCVRSREELWTEQRGIVYGAMTVNEIIEENLKQKNCTSVVSLDVRGAFHAAWWPSIVHNLKELK